MVDVKRVASLTLRGPILEDIVKERLTRDEIVNSDLRGQDGCRERLDGLSCRWIFWGMGGRQLTWW